LDLAGNQITELSDQICMSLGNLISLNLANNKLKYISGHIKAIMPLEVLDLSNNQLTTLPSSLCNLKLLEELYFN
jgi:Leucine-rich repeat (LRR) protein